MKQWRHELLKEGNINTYQQIQRFFLSPSKDKAEDIRLQIDFEKQEMLYNDLYELVVLYRKDSIKYRKLITEGQAIIWDELLRCYLDICELTKVFDQRNCELVDDSYLTSANALTGICDIYAQMLARVSTLEKVLGADRFLDRINYDSFSIVDEIINKYKNKLNRITTGHKTKFQQDWNTTSIPNIIYHKLRKQDNSPICNMFDCKQEHVMLFIIDGFGYCQYLWHSHLDKEKHSYTYNEGLFRWLSKENCLKCFPVGCSYITDTAAGLAQIFIGKDSATTGIIASKYCNPVINHQVVETKRIDRQVFNNTFDTRWNSMFDVLTLFDIKTTMYYCSRYSNPPLGFSRYIFGDTNVTEVIPAERIFSLLKDEIDAGATEGLQVIYMSGIDNSGHTMGAYSKFERYEHDKLNGLLRNFLIELAETNAELFDGRRSILITADHGMSESAKLMIDRYSIKKAITDNARVNAVVVENNRALFVYNIPETAINSVKETLEEHFNSKDIWVDIITIQDSIYNQYFITDTTRKQSHITPEIVVRLIDNGLFYSNQNINPHLLHYGGHGGASVDEVFVPIIEITLDNNLLIKLRERFVNI